MYARAIREKNWEIGVSCVCVLFFSVSLYSKCLFITCKDGASRRQSNLFELLRHSPLSQLMVAKIQKFYPKCKKNRKKVQINWQKNTDPF